ncbi:class I SAM-dependent methyltransferase [Gilvibacter sediminis]|uniref:class I SAM-dependent methyltransferase n=1 Tax=Gilvibacter sediminis TaxID=379071 RepID=UPI002350F471|nr:class I SAM-dependent methyltransferase [Gilvibacter sediminis]MDC7999076.1 class I SAM-dependent methyltransferase [Gilvibacter sediminis]
MDYKAINKASWNTRTAAHVTSEFYDLPGFLKGKNSLNSIELELLGEVKSKSILHLQCHFGQDSLSLARMGAKVTGVDLSDAAIDKARELNSSLGLDAEFICCDLYELPEHLNKQYDIVFTSYGTIGWLPNLDRWASVVNRFLKPGGEFIMAEFHPVVWMYDDDFKGVIYNYFNDGPIKETSSGSYTDTDHDFEADYVTWNHPLSEVLTALLDQKLSLAVFQEFDYSPYDCFAHTVEVAPEKFQLKPFDNKIPLVYALKCTKQ